MDSNAYNSNWLFVLNFYIWIPNYTSLSLFNSLLFPSVCKCIWYSLITVKICKFLFPLISRRLFYASQLIIYNMYVLVHCPSLALSILKEVGSCQLHLLGSFAYATKKLAQWKIKRQSRNTGRRRGEPRYFSSSPTQRASPTMAASLWFLFQIQPESIVLGLCWP